MTAFNPVWIKGVEENLQKKGLLPKGSPIVVAVSGGLDSMVLLHVLQTMAAKNEWKLLVAHFNHQLRGRASDADERLVARVASKFKLPMVCGRGNVTELRKEAGISLEMAARKLRHEFLAKAAIQFSRTEEMRPDKGLSRPKSGTKKLPNDLLQKPIATVALAHHADDQSELFFLRLFRGAGGEGIAGMRWSNVSSANPTVRLVRPLLNQTKSVLLAYADRKGIPFREDASNRKIDILRNRIRHGLLPMIRDEFQPDLDAKISRLMETVGAEADFVKTEAQNWLDQKKRTHFEQMPVAVQRQVMRLQLRSAGVEPDFECVEQLRENLNQPVSVARDLMAVCDGEGRIIVSAPRSLDFRSDQVILDFGNNAGHAEMGGLRIEWEVFTGKALGKLKKDLVLARENRRKNSKERPQTHAASVGCEYFDADAIGYCATLRHWRAGDRFQPIGMKQTAKVQNILTNLKFPAADRRSIVVGAAENQELFWVQGLRMSEPFKVGPQTARCLRWNWRPCGTDSIV